MMTQDQKSKSETKTPRLMEAMHDEAPSNIVDHPFQPKAEWWSLCGFIKPDGRRCNLAESAHAETTLPFGYIGDDSDD